MVFYQIYQVLIWRNNVILNHLTNIIVTKGYKKNKLKRFN